MTGTPRCRARAWGLCALLAACETPATTPTDMIAVDTGEAELVAPIFIEPTGGSIRVAATRQQDLSLEVTNIDAAGTVLTIDGTSVGALRGDPAVGSLSAETLRLTMRGAMVAAEHTLQLHTVRGADPLASETITLIVRGEPDPVLTATLGAPQLQGANVTSWGAGLLGVLDFSAVGPPTLSLVSTNADGQWGFDDVRTVALPGFVLAPGDASPALSATRIDDGPVGDDQTVEDQTVLVAWRQGQAGRAVAVLRSEWETADLATPSVTVLDLAAPVIGPVEYAAWGRPWLAGDVLLAELVAATDTETPRPGDRAIISARIGADATLQGPARRLSFGERVDLDAIGPAIDIAHAEAAGGPTFVVRMQQRRTAVVEVADNGTTTLRVSRAEESGVALTDATGPIAAVVGALGSRTSIAETPGGLMVQRSADGLRAPVQTLAVPTEAAEPSAWTAAPTVTTIGGAVVVLLCQGTAMPVLAVTAAGDVPVVTPLPDLACDSLAAPPRPPSPDAPLPLACARDGEIWDATLVGSESG